MSESGVRSDKTYFGCLAYLNCSRLQKSFIIAIAMSGIIEAYKALRDRALYPINQVVGHLIGNLAFVTMGLIFKVCLILSAIGNDNGRINMVSFLCTGESQLMGVFADDGFNLCVAFADDADLLKELQNASCGDVQSPMEPLSLT
ncbi:hypothetical protein L1987_61058 [Smallanthus sonchifolius]|uniref:Uncharacterized protein n=1 Tax=Smallanthus sonchifolius TaxID=185202 RepID=A0ACB9DAP3_9ASTR|nr:hypothetical protein L1987_61058 [Smallanthus sonchifolius]